MDALSDDERDAARLRLERKDGAEAVLSSRIDGARVELVLLNRVVDASKFEADVDLLGARERVVPRLSLEVDLLRIGDLGVDLLRLGGGHADERRARVDDDLVVRDPERLAPDRDVLQGDRPVPRRLRDVDPVDRARVLARVEPADRQLAARRRRRRLRRERVGPARGPARQ